ncbi:MAG: hypothetical protein ACRDV9_07035 [Acidimicrobiia bacterium]
MAWQLESYEVLIDWLEQEGRAEVRDHVTDWLATSLLRDPDSVEAYRASEHRANVFVAYVPSTMVTITYLVADEFRTVRLIEIRSLF